MKGSKILVFMLAVLLVVTMFAGCSKPAPTGEPAAAEPSGENQIKIGLSLPTQREERWVRDKEKMEEVAAQMGVELIVKVADANTQEQITQVESLLTQGIDVLILAPHDASASATLVDKAKQEGIPVIAYDRLITNTDKLDVYMSFDNVKVGELQGKYITEQVPEGKYIIMSGAPTDNNAKLFKEGAMKYIQPLIDSGKIQVITEQAVENWVPENALKIVEAALAANNNEVDAILAPNDGTAGAAIQALAAQGLAGKVPITGQDAEKAAAKRVMEGTQSMTIYKDTRALGKKAIEVAVALAKGEKLETNGALDNGKIQVPSVLIESTIVTKDTLKEVLIDSGYITEDDLK
ncbi:D-xylose transport system substrate-binding protein [Anaerosolibacter carboniphilus]|uniref:D-xylose transport system substrate-binding protein n=1 Tax=Anaerosolibacter carboniphilus TaxID=1417629 RepID=A0A841KVS4_9FIRM|nr:substrate-binding domain-containing protein [Anaerosolibacter carboniphilus]MBB6217483.1 D-xylose transport system substrate-binding protein [Anaerosolibacter carboniphilus]